MEDGKGESQVQEKRGNEPSVVSPAGAGLTYPEAETILQQLAGAVSPDGLTTGPGVLAALSRSGKPPSRETGQGFAHSPAEARLRMAELRYQTLVEQIPAVTFMAGLDEGLPELYVSPQIEALLGFSQKEWLENPILWYAQLHPDDRERWQAEFARTCATGMNFRSEYRFLAREGRVVWVRGECQVVRDEQGHPLFLQGIAYDITESKRAEEVLRGMHHNLEILVRERTAELAQANESLHAEIVERQRLEEALLQRAEQLAEESRRKDHFLAVLAHELRNPLAPITTVLQLLRRPGVGKDNSEWALGLLERQVRHMTRLIEDLLDVSRINQGKIELRKEQVDLAAIIIHALETTRPALGERRHELTMSLPAEPVPLEGDPVRLEQVVTNLLTNAAKYTEPGGRVWVTAEREAEEAVLRVRDTGIGIPPEMLERIFDIFTQVNSAVARPLQWGLGVGLTLVRRLVELHGGSVKAFSAGPGRGSEFVIRLPLQPRDAETAGGGEPGTAEPPGATGNLRHRVLVVDDHREFAESMALLLRSWGHEVRLAFDGASALAAARASPPEVVFLDIGLPGLDGYQVAGQLREQPALRQALLVALTGYGRTDDHRRFQEAGFNYHLVKPVGPGVLQELLANYRPGLMAPTLS